MEGVSLPVSYPKVNPLPYPRLVPGCGGWHIIIGDDQVCGKVVRLKGTDRRIVVLKGTVREIREIVAAGLLTKLV